MSRGQTRVNEVQRFFHREDALGLDVVRLDDTRITLSPDPQSASAPT
jgi:hypothetical protein